MNDPLRFRFANLLEQSWCFVEHSRFTLCLLFRLRVANEEEPCDGCFLFWCVWFKVEFGSWCAWLVRYDLKFFDQIIYDIHLFCDIDEFVNV